MVGDSQEMFFGQTLAVGNLDGDRYSDLLIGSPLYDDDSNADAGVIHVLLGETLKDTWGTSLRSDELSHSIVGAAAYDSFGSVWRLEIWMAIVAEIWFWEHPMRTMVI